MSQLSLKTMNIHAQSIVLCALIKGAKQLSLITKSHMAMNPVSNESFFICHYLSFKKKKAKLSHTPPGTAQLSPLPTSLSPIRLATHPVSNATLRATQYFLRKQAFRPRSGNFARLIIRRDGVLLY